MKHQEFYVKYKTNYEPLKNPLFTKRKWWRVIVIIVFAVLIGPLILYKHQRSHSFTFDYYLKLAKIFLVIIVPIMSFLLWANWRELAKRSKGYGWVGKFKIVGKRSAFAFRYFLLEPGNGNRLAVDRRLFNQVRLGDFILIRRDPFGKIEEINKVSNVSGRLSKGRHKRFPKSPINLLGQSA